jgi:hypothetical protein
MQYLDLGFYPVYAPAEIFVNWRGKIPPSLWSKVIEQTDARSLRIMAKEYGVSHESVRRALQAADTLYQINRGRVHNDPENSALK